MNPTYKDTDKNLEIRIPSIKRSGFGVNRDYMDGNGWKPLPVLNPKNIGS
jgi:hypothetical protein